MSTTNNDVLNLMDEFLKPIKIEKQAADDINEVKKTNGADPVTPEVDKGDGQNQGAFGTEKEQDIKEGTNGAIAADSPAAENKDGDSDKPVDDQGTKSLDSSQAVSQPSVTVHNTSDPQEDNAVNNKGETGGHDKMAKMRRNAFLADNINQLIAKSNEAPAVEKQAAQAPAPQAAPAAPAVPAEPTEGQLYDMARQRGIEKRAEDEAELMAAGMTPEEASATLDTVAEANPAAVLPEEAEAAPELPAEVAPEAAPEAGAEGVPGSPEELAAALDEAGVSVEELAEAVGTVQELEQAGVAPEEIVAAVQNAAGDAEAPVEKAAAERQQVIQSHLGLLKANQ